MVDSVIVAIEVSSCNECPHFYKEWGDRVDYCYSANRELTNQEGFDVPEWCPFRKPHAYADARIE